MGESLGEGRNLDVKFHCILRFLMLKTLVFIGNIYKTIIVLKGKGRDKKKKQS